MMNKEMLILKYGVLVGYQLHFKGGAPQKCYAWLLPALVDEELQDRQNNILPNLQYPSPPTKL